jgi:hypothetical protein
MNTKLDTLKAVYRTHRDGCNTCNPSELCDDGLDLYEAVEAEKEWTQSDAAEYAQRVE